MVRAPLRVCHVIHGLQPGGAEQLLVEMAKARSSACLDISVLSLMATGDSSVARALRETGVRLESCNLASRWDPRALPRARSVIADLSPNVVHTHLKHADLVGAAAAASLRIPQVSTLHLIEDTVGGVGRLKRGMGAAARMHTAGRTIAVSDAQRSWYLSTFRADASRVVTVHNGVGDRPPQSPADRERLRSDLGLRPGDVAAVMVGVMRHGKGHADLLAAARKIPAGSPLRIVLAGDGPLRCELERSAAATGETSRVIFAGWCSDVPALLGASEIIVHPTLFDALPTALIEGLAAGIPAVASDVGGVPEIVAPGTGILVTPGDQRGLADAMILLGADPAMRSQMGSEARRRFDAEFSVTLWLERLRSIYEQVIRD